MAIQVSHLHALDAKGSLAHYFDYIQGVRGSLSFPTRLEPPVDTVANPRVPAAMGREGRARARGREEGEGGVRKGPRGQPRHQTGDW